LFVKKLTTTSLCVALGIIVIACNYHPPDAMQPPASYAPNQVFGEWIGFDKDHTSCFALVLTNKIGVLYYEYMGGTAEHNIVNWNIFTNLLRCEFGQEPHSNGIA